MKIPSGTPISICWLITSDCNYSCKFCFKQDNRLSISFEEATRIFKKIANAGIKKISFSGGEPLLWRGNVIDLIKEAKSLGLMTSLITNGSLLTNDILAQLDSCLDWLTLPLDGSNSQVQTKAGRPKGHFEKIISLLDRSVNYKFKLKINTLACRHNWQDIINMPEVIYKYPVKRWRIFEFYPIRGSSIEYQKEYSISHSEFVGMIMLVADKSQKILPKCNIDFATYDKLDKTYFLIAPDATIYYSKDKEDHFIGNIKDEDIICLWKRCQFVDIKYHHYRTRWISKNNENSPISCEQSG
jgi:radical S-adenosyl methionine domain-containing protein 2